MNSERDIRQLHENVARIRDRIAAAAGRAGRSSSDVRLVGVTKYVSVEVARALVDAGVNDLGESRPQELWRKAEAIGADVCWHMIGHLQRNKVRRTLPAIGLLHSGESLRLLEAVNEEGALAGHVTSVLVEVNISGDATKHGFRPEEVAAALPRIATLKHVAVKGLMTMAALEGGEERARRDFAALRALRDSLIGDVPPGIGLGELSMGMSDDFEQAIEEGATIVRVGSALFEGLAAAEGDA